MEYNLDNNWIIFIVIENNDEFIGLKDKNNGFLKLKHDNFDLIPHLFYKNKYFYTNTSEEISVNWDLINYNCYSKEE